MKARDGAVICSPVALSGGEGRGRGSLLLDRSGVTVVRVTSGGPVSLPGLGLTLATTPTLGRSSSHLTSPKGLVRALLVARGRLCPRPSASHHVRNRLVVSVCRCTGMSCSHLKH